MLRLQVCCFKTEHGLVRLNIQSSEDLRVAYTDSVRPTGQMGLEGTEFLVEEQVAGGIEMILNVSTAYGCGPVFTIGFGVIQVELLQDITTS